MYAMGAGEKYVIECRAHIYAIRGVTCRTSPGLVSGIERAEEIINDVCFIDQ
jgi:hypothetical protein